MWAVSHLLSVLEGSAVCVCVCVWTTHPLVQINFTCSQLLLELITLFSHVVHTHAAHTTALTADTVTGRL